MSAGVPGVVTLSGETISPPTVASGTPPRGEIVFRADGTVDKIENGATSQIDTATDWIFPNSRASDKYDLRYTSQSGDIFTAEASAEDTWIDLGTDRIYTLTRIPVGTSTNTVTFEIRNNAGTTVASTVYVIEANSSG